MGRHVRRGGSYPWFGRAVGAVVAAAILAGASTPPAAAIVALPGRVWVRTGTARTLVSDLPRLIAVSATLPERRLPGGAVEVAPGREGTYRVTLSLLGLVPVRQVTVEAVPPLAATPGGQAIGVLLDADGVLVVADDPAPGAAAAAGLRAGDLVLAADGQPVRSKDRLAAAVDAAGRAGRSVELTVLRSGGLVQVRLQPQWDARAGRYLIGAWVRDGVTGIGTLTFYDTGQAVFAALGHVVADAATGQPYPVRQGRIVPAVVSGLARGRQGDPGEKLGVYAPGAEAWGDILANTPVGIFGRLLTPPGGGLIDAAVPIALEDQVQPGPAEMLTVIAGTRVQPFAIDIERVVAQARPEGKGLVLRVTDPRLLRETGGIVQGMSGSPILQDGRLVGAVTHVFVNDPTRGYGVLAIWMAERAGLWHP